MSSKFKSTYIQYWDFYWIIWGFIGNFVSICIKKGGDPGTAYAETLPLWVVGCVSAAAVVATLGRHLVICWRSLLLAELCGKTRLTFGKKFAPHHLVSILSAKLSHSLRRKISTRLPCNKLATKGVGD